MYNVVDLIAAFLTGSVTGSSYTIVKTDVRIESQPRAMLNWGLYPQVIIEEVSVKSKRVLRNLYQYEHVVNLHVVVDPGLNDSGSIAGAKTTQLAIMSEIDNRIIANANAITGSAIAILTSWTNRMYETQSQVPLFWKVQPIAIKYFI